jgi:beta-N-acetylhexosaminidase
MNARLLLAPGLACLLAGSLTVPAAAVPAPDVELSAPAGTAAKAETAKTEATAATVFARMSEAQRLGQLFMVGTPAASVDPATRTQIGRYHVGNAMLTGRSHGGTRPPARVAAALQARATGAATRGVRLLVATDQEGGDVQVLHGPGLSELPSGLQQGTLRPARLRSDAATWARELRRAGVNMNLAPVLDTVPSPAAAAANPPIGQFDRQYGFDPTVVARHGIAFARGMADRGVVAVVKHFPGLGRVHANPDVSSGVVDRVTGPRDPYLRPFQQAIGAGVPSVMISTAYYSRLDARNPAAFSRSVIHRLLRRQLGFRGVVISDDLGNAGQIAAWSPGARAVRFLGAGGDLVLTVNPATLPAMYRAVQTRAAHSPRFRARVHHAVLRVLELKEQRSLLPR